MTSSQILQARQSLGLSVNAMAQRLGIDRNTYGKWERGEQRAPAIAATAIKWLLSGKVE
jgi:transcriptional regulator with XRE-family HTH domain